MAVEALTSSSVEPWNLSFMSLMVNPPLNFLPRKFAFTRAAAVSLGRMCVCFLNLRTRSVKIISQANRRHVYDCFPADQFIAFNRTITWYRVDQWRLRLALDENCLHSFVKYTLSLATNPEILIL